MRPHVITMWKLKLVIRSAADFGDAFERPAIHTCWTGIDPQHRFLFKRRLSVRRSCETCYRE
jgi:hypothetical protein